ncbi:P-loop NTPase fold protein [Massilia sp. SR12]
MANDVPEINVDRPLKVGGAGAGDRLRRGGFAQSAVTALRGVNSAHGLVLAIEGAWGSGKTSALALIEEQLRGLAEESRPLVIHFNPWLIGDRDALLGQFLAKLAGAVSLPDHAKNGKKVAKELAAYSKAFDVLRLVPGVEPWASIVKSVFSLTGSAVSAVSDLKSPDLEGRKGAVANALAKFPRPIIVIIDDIDRLFPLEVYEMVRIVKAVGDLPNIGYVLAWDANYVADALIKASVPDAKGYLDKIVQVRMPLPLMSPSARQELLNTALERLPAEALAEHF